MYRGRELVVALPESCVQYKADDVVKLFTETFHKRYGVECSSVLHHNKTKTNYHIHLVLTMPISWGCASLTG